jgi:multicomponent K+:H+ antiporter subunit A
VHAAGGRCPRDGSAARSLRSPRAPQASSCCSRAPGVLSGDAVVASWSWIPEFRLHFALRPDGLSFLFAFRVLAIGLLALFYSYGNLGEEEPLGRFLGLMLGFMGGMLGVVLSENLLLLALFWRSRA